LRAWNIFIVALEQKPVRIYRITLKRYNEWEAEFKRKDGSRMFVTTEALKGGKVRTAYSGMCGTSRLVEIANGIKAWLDNHQAEFVQDEEEMGVAWIDEDGIIS
jgi:hypothetical protein